MQLANARLGNLSGQLQGIPSQARSVLCPAVRLHVAPVPPSPPRAPSTHQEPHHPPTTENNALLWREVPSPQSHQEQQRSPLQQHHHLPEAEFDKQLNKEITACSSWRHLRALLHAHAQSMNSVHVSALVSRLAKVSPFTAATGFSEGGHSSNTDSSTPRSPSMHTSGAVAAADACQTTAASRSPSTVERRALDHFMGEVSQLVSSRLDTFDARALSNVLWAVAKLGFCPSHGLLQRFLFAAYVSMQDMQPQEVANLAWALATMRIHPGAPWTSRLLERISNAAGGMRPQELAHCTWAIQQLLEAHCDAQQQLEHRREQQQQQQYGSSQAQGLGRPAGTSASLAHSALEVRYLSALHAIQQSAEGALEGFKARELMMLLLSLHRMRHRLVAGGQTQSIPPLMLLLQQAGGQQAGGQQARSMMASHHRLLVAALQSPQLTSHLSSLSPLDVSNLAGLVARDVKLQQQAARQGTVFHTWHMIYEQRAIGQLARAVVADSQSRMEQYAPHDLLGLVTALSTMQAAGLPRAWLSACAHRIGTTLLISDASSSSSSCSSSSHAIEGPTAAGFPGSVRGVESSGGVGCLAPGADPRQHICAHATLASLLCGMAKLSARAGIPKKGSSSASGSRSGEASGREYSVAEASRDGCNERSNKEYTVVERGSDDGDEKSSKSSRELMGELASNRSSDSNRSRGGWRQGSYSQRVVGSVDFVARPIFEKCLRAALPRMEMHKLAVVAWSLAELQCPWSPQLIATLQQRMHQLLLPFLLPSAAADTTSHPYTSISTPTPTIANSRSSSNSSSPLGSATGIESTASPSELTCTSSTPTPAEPLGLNEVSMLLWGVERLQLQLDASTARALAYVTASAATAAVGTQGLQHLQERSRPSNSMTAVWGQARVRPAVRTGRQVRAPPQAPSSPPTPNTDAQMAPHSVLPPPWNTVSASASLSSRTTSTAGIRQPQSPLSVPTTHATKPTSQSGSPSSPVQNDRSSGGGSFQTRQASLPIPNQTSYQATATTHQVPHQTSDQASHTTHQPIHTQAPPHTLQRAAAAASLHSKHSAGYAQGSTAPTAGAHAHRAAALTAAAAAATSAPVSAVAGSGSSSGRLTGVQDLAWAATSLCTLQARSRIRVWRGTTKEALEQALTTAARFLQPQQLCTLMLALGQAQAHPSEHLVAALLHQSLHLLPSLGPTHMSRLLCGLARLGYQPLPLWLARTLSHTQALLPECSTEEASWMLWAFAKLRVALPSAWVRTWHQHLLAHSLYAQHSPRAAVRAAWALHVLRIKLPDHSHALLVQAAAQSGERLSREEALWLLRVAVGWQLYLEHEDWGRLLLQGVLHGKPPTEAVAEMPLRHQHILLSCMAHGHMRWTRCWDEWREVHRALGGRHTAGGSGLVGIWRRTTRPRRWERRLWAHTSKTQRRKHRHVLALTWEAYKATKPRQLCSVWRFREKYWDK